MNKKLVATLLTAGMAAALSVGASAEENYKIGFSFYNLSNPVWAELVEEAVAYGAEKDAMLPMLTVDRMLRSRSPRSRTLS